MRYIYMHTRIQLHPNSFLISLLQPVFRCVCLRERERKRGSNGQIACARLCTRSLTQITGKNKNGREQLPGGRPAHRKWRKKNKMREQTQEAHAARRSIGCTCRVAPWLSMASAWVMRPHPPRAAGDWLRRHRHPHWWRLAACVLHGLLHFVYRVFTVIKRLLEWKKEYK